MEYLLGNNLFLEEKDMNNKNPKVVEISFAELKQLWPLLRRDN